MKSRIYIVEHWNSDVKSIENNENDSKVSKTKQKKQFWNWNIDNVDSWMKNWFLYRRYSNKVKN